MQILQVQIKLSKHLKEAFFILKFILSALMLLHKTIYILIGASSGCNSPGSLSNLS